MSKFEKWAIRYAIENWGWNEDTTVEELQQGDWYQQMKDTWNAAWREAREEPWE